MASYSKLPLDRMTHKNYLEGYYLTTLLYKIQQLQTMSLSLLCSLIKDLNC